MPNFKNFGGRTSKGGWTSLVRFLKTCGVLKSKYVARAFEVIDRVDFVPKEFREAAYEDTALPTLEGQTISQPYVVAFMLDLLDPQPGETILDVGAGSGWQTALLAYIVNQPAGRKTPGVFSSTPGVIEPAGKVYAFERVPEVCEFGKKNVEKYNFIKKGVVEWICGDATTDLPNVRFDKIIAAASVEHFKRPEDAIPDAWKKRLKVGGKIVMPIGNSVWLFEKQKDGSFAKKEYPGFVFVPLVRSRTSNSKGFTPLERQNTTCKTKNFKKRFGQRDFLTGFTPIAGLFFIAAVFIYFVYGVFFFKPPQESVRSIVIPKGANARMIAENVFSKNLVISKELFLFYIRVVGASDELRTGEYHFDSAPTIHQLVFAFKKGRGIERTIRIIEGWTIEDVANYFEKEGIFSKEQFLSAVRKFEKDALGILDLQALQIDTPGVSILEGYLFPDTYRIFLDASAEDVIKKMINNLNEKLTLKMRGDIESSGRSISEIIIMASMLEKEAAVTEDKKVIADILWRRLDENIGLQVDAALTYVLGKKSHELTTEDLKFDSPYNTYRYRGLPVGPIANPGMDSILAAVYPTTNEFWYYLSDDEGKIHYSKTFDEHKQNKFKYLR